MDIDCQVTGTEIIQRCVFSIFTYAIVAYKIEQLRKESYFGRESQVESFKRWRKVFDKFADGVALVSNQDSKDKDNHEVIYANKNLYNLLDLNDTELDQDKDPEE